jgi:SpoVK/Ycf46/Vps4 family AAA+-type ATPase
MNRIRLEEEALSVAKKYDHSELHELHVIRAILSQFPQSQSVMSAVEVEEELSKISLSRNSSFTITTEAAELLDEVNEQNALELLLEKGKKLGIRVTTENLQEFQSKTQTEVEINLQETLEDVLQELDNLVGLEGVKSQVKKLVNVHQANKIRVENNFPSVPVGLHLVFTGSPGTGKTTVARLIARAYKAIGLLPSGQLIEVDRANLVAGYVGQTALKVQESIARAHGGILFIDEAYSLSADSGAGFGDEAISTIVKAMEDNRDSLAVIVAGYKEPMETFIKSNQGLRSRFQNTLAFEDYDTEQLIRIFIKLSNEYKITVTEEVLIRIKNYFSQTKPGGELGNARFVRNLFEKMFLSLSQRAAEDGQINLDEVTTFQIQDIPPIEVRKQTLGFA